MAQRKRLHPSATGGALLEEAPAGSAEALNQDLDRAAKADTANFPRPENSYAYVRYVFPDRNLAIVCVSGSAEGVLYEATYAQDADGTITFSDVKPVIERATIEPVIAEAMKPLRGRQIPISDALIESEVLESGGAERIRGRVILEEVAPGGDIFSARGWLPFGAPGRQSKGSKRVYDREFFESLMPNMATSSIGTLDGRPVYFGPPGAMYASHDAITQRTENPLLSIVGKVTGVEERSGVFGALFETLPTSAGRDMAVLLNCTAFVEHGSVRALPIDESTDTYRGADGLIHARRGCMHGIDFTDMPGTPFTRFDPRVTLEEELPMKILTTEELAALKTSDKAAYDAYLASAAAELAKNPPAPAVPAVKPDPPAAGPSEREKQLEAQNRDLSRSVGRSQLAGMVGNAVDGKASEQKFALTPEIREGVVEKAVDGIDKVLADLEAKNLTPGTPEYTKAAEPQVAAIVESEIVRAKKMFGSITVESLRVSAGTAPGGRAAGDFPNISALTPEGRMHGAFVEEAFGTFSEQGAAQVTRQDVIIAKALDRPVRYSDGTSIFAPYQPGLSAFLEQQRRYYKSVESIEDLFSPNGKLSHAMEDMRKAYLETDEMTFSKVFGANTLVNDVIEGVLRMIYPQTFALQLATQHNDITSETFEVWTENFRRSTRHNFGYVDKANSYAGAALTSGTVDTEDFADDTAITTGPGGHVYGFVTEAITTAAYVITLTGVNTNGETVTLSATFPVGDAVGTIRRFRPSIVGDKFTDVTLATTSGAGGSGAGCVGIYTPEALGYTENAQPALSIIELSKATSTCVWMELMGAMTQRTMWNFLKSVKDGPGRGYAGMTQLVTLLVQEIVAELEKKFFYAVIAGATGSNQSLDLTILPSGSTQKEYNETFIEKLGQTADEVSNWTGGLRPTWCVAEESDRTRIETYTRGALTTYTGDRRDAFHNSLSIGKLHGMDIFFSQHAYARRLILGSKGALDHGTYVPIQLLGPQWNPTNGNQYVDRLTCQKTHVSRPTALGTLQITAGS